MNDPIIWQWGLLILFGIGFFFLVPVAKKKEEFFSALSEKGKRPGFMMLTSSLVISWIFAKSITNAANLGLLFGFVGGVAYAVYYLSFLVAGIVIYQLRVKGGFKSIHQFLQRRFGRGALLVFSLLIGIRLFNEVWSNTMVIGSYFGEAGSNSYYAAVLVFTGLTLAYVLKGGLRSSLLTDAIQMVFFGVLLFILLGFILPASDGGVAQYVSSGEWTMEMGLNLLFAALLQVFSYPFHDPVMTDRGFISDAKTTLRSYIAATFIGFLCLVVFSFVGIFARFEGLEGQAAVEVSKLLGVVAMLAMNFIMVTSAASTLDSTFSSFSKLIVIDLEQKKQHTLRRGRIMMVLLAIAGTLPIFFNPEILSATTVSGTMVMGLAPVFLLWKIKAPSLSFHLPVAFGIAVGIILAVGAFPTSLVFTSGKYASLLWANVWGLLGCFILFLIPLLFKHGAQKSTKHIGELSGPVLVFGGVYSNLQSLEQLQQIATDLQIPAQQIICTGDIVAYCAQPEETVQAVRDWGIHTIAGNVEIQLREGAADCACDFREGSRCDTFSQQWYPFAQAQLSEASIAWMHQLPDFIRFRYAGLEGLVVHGSFHHTSEFIFASTPWPSKQANFEDTKAQLILAGHCGLPFSQQAQELHWLNPGVIGMPANDGTARVWYMLLEEHGGELHYTHHSYTYDNELAAQLMNKHHLPASYAATLGTGIWDNCEILPEEETLQQGKTLEAANL